MSPQTLRLLALTAAAGLAACSAGPLDPSPVAQSVAAAGLVDAKGGHKPPAEQPVTVAFRCPGPACAGGDRLFGDGTPYAAVIDSTGNLRLTLEQPGRAVTLDYTDCLAPCPAGRRWFTSITVGPDSGLLVHTSVLVPGTESETPGGLLDIAIGQTWLSRIKIGFRATSPAGEALVWGIRFNPFFPGSTNLQVTRASENEWFVEATPAQIAYAVSVASTRGKPGSGDVFEGNYVMPFRIEVTR